MNSPIILIVVVIVFVGVMTTGSFLYWGYKSREEDKARELARRLGTVQETGDAVLLRLNPSDPLVDTLGNIGRDLENLIKQAGNPYDLSGLFTRMGIFGLAGIVTFGVLIRGPVAGLGILVGLLPIAILSSRATERAMELSRQLPDALDLVGRSLQAGHGLSDAMRLCAQEMPMPVAAEFGRVYEEHNLGRDMREALSNLSERNPRNFDLKIFVSSVLLQRDTGGNLIEILDNIAGTIRERGVFKQKVAALTAEARISAVILGGLPFVLAALIMVVRPDYLGPLVFDPWGRIGLGMATVMFFVGVFVMVKLCDIEV